MSLYDVIVIGGGPAGCFAGIFAGRRGAKVLLLERNEKIGKKLYITGKGRCNLTNNSEPANHLNNIINGKKFMRGASMVYTAQDVMDFFEQSGLNLKTERGNRVFPESDKSSDVIKILEKELKKSNVEIKFNSKVESISKFDNIYNIKCDNNTTYSTKCVIIATGGNSYMPTGSDGSGYTFAKNLGHSIVDIKPGLIPIILNDNVKDLEGLSLKNVTAYISIQDKIIEKEFGEMLFTNEGVSGPIILTMSSKINRLDLTNAKLFIDFKPALDEKTLDEKFVREFNENPNKNLSNYLKTLLPANFAIYFVKKLGFDKNLSQINKNERKQILQLMKRFDFSIKKLDNINKAIITSGGVDLVEINPKTMESKISKGLYFAGEIMDIDALTGGFNLQVAFSTGYIAGSYCEWSEL